MAAYEKDKDSLSLEVASLVFKFWLRASGAEAGKRMVAIYEELAKSASTSPEWTIKTLACFGYGSDIDRCDLMIVYYIYIIIFMFLS
jgi:hypothetical protein